MSHPIVEALNDPRARLPLVSESLLAWTHWYEPATYSSPPAPFHADWMDALDAGKNIVCVGARDAGKTVYVRSHVLRAICTRKKRCILWVCADKEVAEGRLGDITTQLQVNARLQRDFGRLYQKVRDPVENEEQKGRLKMADFITSNGVRVLAGSPGMNVRGAQWQDREGATHRPDLIVVDDIDTNRNANSVEQIDKLHRFVNGELFGAASDDCQLIFLGNVISADGVGQRLHKDKARFPDWRTFWQPIVDKDDSITWPGRFVRTDAELRPGMVSLEKKMRDQGEIAFNQNYRLIPYAGGESIFRREWMRWAVPGDLSAPFDRVEVVVDPANSEKTHTDSFAVTAWGHKGVRRIMLDGRELKGPEKDDKNALAVVEGLYRKWGANELKIETVGYQATLARLLRERGLAVTEVKRHKDKVTRAKEVQAEFQNGNVLFNPDCPASHATVEQLVNFPNVTHDDLADTVFDAVARPKFVPVYL